MKLYTMPELRFAYDESVERGDRLSRLIDDACARRAGATPKKRRRAARP